MDTRSFKLASLMLALSLVGSARPATAQPRPSLNIVLHLCDDPGIQANLVNRAGREMTRIYRDAGVDINWISDAAAKEGPDDPQPLSSTPPLTRVILRRQLTAELT